mmetsp:Transcript_9839/g.59944  ORF Transcript_9839/g.59944 Transcript_9839/m.59944 type:complete len:143 (+) Transcript_9839:791-1219(+)
MRIRHAPPRWFSLWAKPTPIIRKEVMEAMAFVLGGCLYVCLHPTPLKPCPSASSVLSSVQMHCHASQDVPALKERLLRLILMASPVCADCVTAKQVVHVGDPSTLCHPLAGTDWLLTECTWQGSIHVTPATFLLSDLSNCPF